jgi:hypothetical protein
VSDWAAVHGTLYGSFNAESGLEIVKRLFYKLWSIIQQLSMCSMAANQGGVLARLAVGMA